METSLSVFYADANSAVSQESSNLYLQCFMKDKFSVIYKDNQRFKRPMRFQDQFLLLVALQPLETPRRSYFITAELWYTPIKYDSDSAVSPG